MKVFIRADASPQIGTGHLVRCRTLASELRARGADVRFICRAHPGHANKLVEDEGFRVMALPPPVRDAQAGPGYSAWLGVSQDEDAKQTLGGMEGGGADLLIVDHYALDAHWERAVQRGARRIMVIDDLANRPHDCDILLDQTYGAEASDRYKGLVPPDCMLLLGPRYALLRPEYRLLGPRLRDKVERVLVFFGGADIDNVTGLALDALAAPELSKLDVDVVIGPANPHREAIEVKAARRGRVVLHQPRPHLADLMSRADLAVGAGGATTWERLCLGLPAIIVAIAGNQVQASRALSAAGLIDYAGELSAVTVQSLRERISALLDRERLSYLSRIGPSAVDGWGALRTAELLMPDTLSGPTSGKV
ncbi:UDP-2,4-diacetamido-2,4,6-trideoxy-beta-L-altropyranose hydrolase [Microvirga sp. TS319]|uniref:UDP-2,4-diacetamido-2,4, 6-trideoxy-beta-L-altropyranose hydrolase n=1 Tax=Microvirga sp. TS319 TaxID=3241165 RepID=UPI00351A96D3